MTGERVIVHCAQRPNVSLCADVLGEYALLTSLGDYREVQLLFGPDECRRLGEWLIERADQP